MKKIKKYLASINLTIFLFACLIGAWRGIDPCSETLEHFMSLAGVDTMEAGVVHSAPEGPPLKADFEIKLADGRVITVLSNGGININ